MLRTNTCFKLDCGSFTNLVPVWNLLVATLQRAVGVTDIESGLGDELPGPNHQRLPQLRRHVAEMEGEQNSLR